ncbi:putative holin [Gilliamella sp. CG25]
MPQQLPVFYYKLALVLLSAVIVNYLDHAFLFMPPQRLSI